MATQGGLGVKIKIPVGAPTPVQTVVAHLLEVEFPELEKVLAEVTAHDSPGGWAEFIDSGKRNAGEFAATLLWDPAEATHAAIISMFEAKPAVEMSIEDPASTEILTFDAHIQKMGRVAEMEEGYKCEVTIQPTGPVVITP